MKQSFAQNLTIVTFAHFAFIFCLVLVAAIPGLRRPVRILHPVQLAVFDTSSKLDGPPVSPVHREPDIQPVPVQPEQPAEVHPEPPKPRPKPVVSSGISKPAADKIKPPKAKPANQDKKTTQDRKKRRPKVSAADIAAALRPAVGPRTAGHAKTTAVNVSGAVSADADAPYFAALKDAFYDAWIQPSYADAGGAATTVAFQLVGDGLVTRMSLSKSSGNPVMDASVMQAVRSVNRVEGLSADFVRRHQEIEIVFRVEKERTGL